MRPSIDEYRTRGYTVFRQILPPSLIADLRRVCDEARDLARRQRGLQAQRLQRFVDALDTLREAGYSEVSLFLHRQRQDLPIDRARASLEAAAQTAGAERAP